MYVCVSVLVWFTRGYVVLLRCFFVSVYAYTCVCIYLLFICIYRRCLSHIQEVYESYTGGVWVIYRRCMSHIQEVFESYTGGVWVIYMYNIYHIFTCTCICMVIWVYPCMYAPLSLWRHSSPFFDKWTNFLLTSLYYNIIYTPPSDVTNTPPI